MRSACIHTHTHAVSSNHNTRANKKDENERERSLRRSVDRELLVGCAAFLFVFSRLCVGVCKGSYFVRKEAGFEVI